MIRVRLATADDQGRLVEFIRDHWARDHIFVHRPDVFRWQYLQDDGRLNMVLAEDSDSEGGSTVLGVLGFIPIGRFSPELGDRDVMLAIWKVRDAGVPPGLGLRLLKFVQNELRPRLIAAIGTSEMVRPIYEVLKYEVDSLRQAAVFHPDRHGALRIADSVPSSAFALLEREDVALVPFDDDRRRAVDRIAREGVPAKSWAYLDERYLRHPWYRYELRAVTLAGEVVGAIVWRSVRADGTHLLRVVDIVGPTEWLRSGGAALQAEVIASDAEYLDIMHLGIDEAVLTAGGFVDLADHPDMVLPNYFSPFERRNVTIELAYKVLDGNSDDVHLFRADSDQDRPNSVAEVDSAAR